MEGSVPTDDYNTMMVVLVRLYVLMKDNGCWLSFWLRSEKCPDVLCWFGTCTRTEETDTLE